MKEGGGGGKSRKNLEEEEENRKKEENGLCPAAAMASSDGDAHLSHRPSAPPDPEVVRNIEVLASFVAQNGPDFELLARRNTAGNPKFSFLKEEEDDDSSSEAKAFYEWRKQNLLHRRFASDGSDDLQLKIFMMAQGSPSFPSRGIGMSSVFTLCIVDYNLDNVANPFTLFVSKLCVVHAHDLKNKFMKSFIGLLGSSTF